LLNLALVDLKAERQLAEALRNACSCISRECSGVCWAFVSGANENNGETGQQTDKSGHKHSTMAAGKGRGKSNHNVFGPGTIGEMEFSDGQATPGIE
jgi:hypothetical protein